jgi:hypothetical protein
VLCVYADRQHDRFIYNINQHKHTRSNGLTAAAQGLQCYQAIGIFSCIVTLWDHLHIWGLLLWGACLYLLASGPRVYVAFPSLSFLLYEARRVESAFWAFRDVAYIGGHLTHTVVVKSCFFPVEDKLTSRILSPCWVQMRFGVVCSGRDGRWLEAKSKCRRVRCPSRLRTEPETLAVPPLPPPRPSEKSPGCPWRIPNCTDEETESAGGFAHGYTASW